MLMDLPDIEIVRQCLWYSLTIVSILSTLTVEDMENGTCIALLACERRKVHKEHYGSINFERSDNI